MIRKWTVAGSPALEKNLDQMVLTLRSRLQAHFSPSDYSAVVIAGGYGRGEGGVVNIKGQESLHNNLDLVWVAPHASRLSLIREKLASEARHFENETGVALDTFVIDEARLKRLPCLVMLYDMKDGHRQLLGEPGKLQHLIRYTEADILPSDMRNLLVNRGALLLINRWLLSQGQPHDKIRQQIIRHGMKAIIGLGDALLFQRGQYHWSYLEKQRRMKEAAEMPTDLKVCYDQAAEFRFRPDYSAFAGQDLHAWNEKLLRLYAQGHPQFEAWRLGQTSAAFNWNSYLNPALLHTLSSEWEYRGTRLRRLKHLLCSRGFAPQLGLRANLGLRTLEPASLLALIFPAVAYCPSDPHYLGWVKQQLEAQAPEASTLLEQYLRLWGRWLDPSLLPRLTAWQKQLQQVEVLA